MSLERPHRRYDPLGREWVLVSPGRAQRPWQGQVDESADERLPSYDPECYLCPGNSRASGRRNPNYEHTFVFTNDFAALQPDNEHHGSARDGLLRSGGVSGTSRVVCFSPRHDLSLGEMDPEGLRRVIDTWADQTAELGADFTWVQVFENRGESMGASNPHPHGQIWASSALPTRPAVEDGAQRDHFSDTGQVLLADYAELEGREGERVVTLNDDWLVIVPFWARWPFETLVLPRFPVARLPDLSPETRVSLARALRSLLARYDNLFRHPFPYSMGWHGAPGTAAAPHWQLHAHFNPPLLRSATIRKFMVGYEMFAEAQRDLTAELAAARLRELPDTHYRLAAPPGAP